VKYIIFAIINTVIVILKNQFMLQTIIEYQKIKDNIPTLLDVSGYRNDFVAKKIGMKPTYFSVKKQRGNWTDKDVQNILTVLTQHNEEVENYLMLEQMRSIENEETITLAEFKKEMGWK
jgi:hypothetical protein